MKEHVNPTSNSQLTPAGKAVDAADVIEGRPKLHPGQAEIKAAAARFNVVNCGRRFGKSTLGEDLAIDPALEGFPVGWFSPDYKSLLENWRGLCRLLRPITSRKSEQEKRLELSSGGIIEFWALDADPECSRGRKYKRVIVDEAAKVRWLMRAWLEAIRANLADFQGDAWFFSTPKGRNDYWELFQRGIDPAHREWRSFKKPTGENPYINADEIVAMRAEMGPRIASQEIDAEFLEVGGRFFDEWLMSDYQSESVHEIWSSSLEIPAHWECWGGFDWGKSAPFAFGLLTIDEHKNIVVIDEEYGPDNSDTQIIDRIKRCLERNRRITACRDFHRFSIYADPAIFPPQAAAKRIGEYTVEKYWKAGLHGMIPANNERVNGWNRVKEYMRARDPHTGVAGLRVFKDRCPNLVRTIPLQVGRDRQPEDCDTMLEDHAVDGMLRYGIQRPRASGSDPSQAVNRALEKRLRGFGDDERKVYG